MTEIRVSPPVSNDELNQLFATAWTNHAATDFAPILSRSLLYVCAYADERLVGFVNVAWDGGIHGFILDTTVHGDYQRRGIGRKLVEAAIEAARAKGIEWLHVDYEPHLDNFYKECGFRHTAAGLLNLKEQEISMLTETQNQNSLNIDALSTEEIVRVINNEDKSVADAVEKVLPRIAQAVDAIVEALRSGGRLIYVGAGTSGRLGVLDAVECVPTYSTSPEMVQGLIAGGEKAITRSVEGAEDKPELAHADLEQIGVTEADIIVGIAASGRTPYVIGALEYARAKGIKTVAISCNVPAPILDAADIAIGVEVGAEVITGSTRMKAGTAQKMVLNMLSTGSMIKLGKVYGNLMVDVQVTNAKLAQRARRIIQQIAHVDEATAQSLLEQARFNVKAAIVMHIKQVDYTTARQLLHDHQGYLREIIG